MFGQKEKQTSEVLRNHTHMSENSFTKASKVEKEGEKRLLKLLPPMRKCIDLNEQRYCGDYLDEEREYHECKFEQADKYGNFFLEIWSNKSKEIVGWMHKPMKAKYLWYGFLNEGKIYVFNFEELKTWFRANQHNYEEKPQNKYKQENDSWGKPVAIKDLQETGLILMTLDF